MRVISGLYKNQQIDAPKTTLTHPMSEKARGAIFNQLGNLSNQIVLDAYAGSGSIAIEALSREASMVVMIENNKLALKTIKQNLIRIKLQQKIDIYSIDVKKFSSTLKFNVIIADPPYDKINNNDLNHLASFLDKNGIFVLSYPSKIPPPLLSNLNLIKELRYGNSKLITYQTNY